MSITNLPLVNLACLEKKGTFSFNKKNIWCCQIQKTRAWHSSGCTRLPYDIIPWYHCPQATSKQAKYQTHTSARAAAAGLQNRHMLMCYHLGLNKDPRQESLFFPTET